MAPKLTIKDDYILVEPRKTDFWEIWELLAQLLKMPEYPHKDVIWVFSDGPLSLTYDDLYKLNQVLKENFPEKVKQDKKAAIVVPTGLGSAMATEYTKIVEGVPVEFKIFSDLDTAEKWIAK